jgi:hypothetical protein
LAVKLKYSKGGKIKYSRDGDGGASLRGLGLDFDFGVGVGVPNILIMYTRYGDCFLIII